MTKLRVDAYVKQLNYIRLVALQAKLGIKTLAQTVDHVLGQFFLNDDLQTQATERLNKVIQDQEKRIQILEHDLKHKELAT